jgi:hypothetical protein
MASMVAEVVMLTLEEGVDFLKQHPDLVVDIQNAFRSGASKEAIKQGIRSAMVATAEEALEAEIGPRP